MELLWFLVSVSIITSVPGRMRRLKVFKRPVLNSGVSLTDLWVDQKLDHFDKHNSATWYQRYQEDDKYFTDPTGPVFLWINGEDPLDGWHFDKTLDYAEQYKALCLGIEHRFYGSSQPTGNLSVSSLRYLSSEQALADVAHFVEYMNDKRNLTGNKWVVFGGSYAGNLAAWVRLKYPHFIHAAVSISGPVLAQVNFKGYEQVVRESLSASSHRCPENFHKAIMAVQNSLKNASAVAEFYNKFKLCTELDPDNILDVKTFISSIAGNVETAVQYNRESLVDVNFLCNAMDNASGDEDLVDKLANLTRTLVTEFQGEFGDCTAVSYNAMMEIVRSIHNGNDNRSWIYQTCTEFGYFQTSSSATDLFSPLIDLKYYVNQCTDIFGEDFGMKRVQDGVKRTNKHYGGLSIANDVTNVVFVHGSLDPWHVLGVYKSSNPKAPAILIDGAAHCALDIEQDDYPPLLEAKKQVGEIIGQFLQTRES